MIILVKTHFVPQKQMGGNSYSSGATTQTVGGGGGDGSWADFFYYYDNNLETISGNRNISESAYLKSGIKIVVQGVNSTSSQTQTFSYETTFAYDVAQTTAIQTGRGYTSQFGTVSTKAFGPHLQVTTSSVNGAWSTSTTTVSYSQISNTASGDWVDDSTFIGISDGPQTFSAAYEADACTVLAFAGPHEIGVYFSTHNMPFTEGKTFPPFGSTSFSYNLKTFYQEFYTVFTYGYIEYNDDGGTFEVTWEEISFFANTPYTTATSSTPIGKRHYISSQTAAVPKQAWGSGDETTQSIVTLWLVKTSSFDTGEEQATSSSKSSSYTYEWVDGGYQVNPAQTAKTATVNITSSTTGSRAYNVFVPVETTIPVAGGGGYLVATAKSGWCVPNSGFHTVEPNSTISPTLSEGGAVAIGSARPGVSLYTPIGAVKPNYPTTTATYIAGQGIAKTEKATSAVAGYTPDSYAFTFEQNGSIAISPNVVVVTRAGASAASSLTLSVIGDASEYASTGNCGGGYKDLSLTWTFVALEAGLLIAFIDDTSSTSFFSSPTTSAFSGSKASSFSFLPCLANSAFNPPFYGRFAILPLYNYDEF